jgi:hypothetical protein
MPALLETARLFYATASAEPSTKNGERWATARFSTEPGLETPPTPQRGWRVATKLACWVQLAAALKEKYYNLWPEH